MDITHPDIVVVGSDGEYLMLVEVKVNKQGVPVQNAVNQLKILMAAMGCSIGILVSGEHIFLLRDSLERSNGESIDVVGEASLPVSLLPSMQGMGEGEQAFAWQVQRWLENLKRSPNLEALPEDLRSLFSEPIITFLRLGEIRAAGPRWSEATR